VLALLLELGLEVLGFKVGELEVFEEFGLGGEEQRVEVAVEEGELQGLKVGEAAGALLGF
jgi:hypothetical protein